MCLLHLLKGRTDRRQLLCCRKHLASPSECVEPQGMEAFPVLGRAEFIGMGRKESIQVDVGPGSLSL